jgi:hypothetical protein
MTKGVLPLWPLSYASITGTRGGIRTRDLPIDSGNLQSPARPGQTVNFYPARTYFRASAFCGVYARTNAAQPLGFGSTQGTPGRNRTSDNAHTPARAGNLESHHHRRGNTCRRSDPEQYQRLNPGLLRNTRNVEMAGQACCVRSYFRRAPFPAAFRLLKVTFELRPARLFIKFTSADNSRRNGRAGVLCLKA